MFGTDPGVEVESAAATILEEHALPAGPLDLLRTLGCAPPVDLDVGFGKGRSLVEWAARGFGGSLLGIEVRRGFAEHAAARLAKAGARGVRILRGDFRALAVRLGPAGAVRRIFFHFPDPWWKKRHLKRQVVSGPVVAELVRLLRPGGEIFVQTDVPERAAEFRAALAAAGLEPTQLGEGTTEPNPFGVRSNRELRCAAAGLPVWSMTFRKGRSG
jgi:tRNA (guanine-N7-)-methyltransferase